MNSYFDALENDLAESGFEDPGRLRSAFEEAYEPLLAGHDAIFAEIEPSEVVVTPGAAQEVVLTLHPETGRGAGMLMIGARDRESGAVSMSEFLPLSWEEESEAAFRPIFEQERRSSHQEYGESKPDPA